MNFFSQTYLEVIQELNSSKSGLNSSEAQKRLTEYGSNTLPEGKQDNLLTIFIGQFKSPLIYILFIASLIVFIVEETKTDGFIILFVLIFNAVLGTIQEGKAQNTLLALKNIIESNATVLRNNKEVIIKDTDLVPGDILILNEGERIGADARVILSNNLQVDESSLTGESQPVHKITDALNNSKTLTSDQINMIFKGTHIVSGHGMAIVTATGLKTVIGKISKTISEIDSKIPLKAKIAHLSHMIVIGVMVLVVVLFLVGIATGKSVATMFIVVVSLTVSTVPEGLPIVMTLILAQGVWRMSKKNVLVKKLQAVEALGQAKIIAVDKTGTLTKNEMLVKRVYINDKIYNIGGIGYEPSGEVSINDNEINSSDHPDILFMGKIATLNANAKVMFSEDRIKIIGDPTEAALTVFGEKIGFYKNKLEQESVKLAEIPFDYAKKYHATIHNIDNQQFSTFIGAPEVILEKCNKIWGLNNTHSALSPEINTNLHNTLTKMSHDGLRMLACAIAKHPLTSAPVTLNEQSLIFVGFFGLTDSLRPEVYEAMHKAKAAGIKVVMITGDHKITATAIARNIGIYQDGDEILTGQEIDSLTDVELSKVITNVSVFARVSPEHKMHIIKAYQLNGNIVAMTGDGVNDAPSLVAADLGVSMGKIGTEVAKSASDLVLLDDNFGSIISAVEEGRNIYKTIKKVILFLFSTNLGEVITISVAIFLNFPLPLLATHIIWLNLVTDSFLDVGLAMDPKDSNLVNGSSPQNQKHLIDKHMFQRMLMMAITMSIGTLFIFIMFKDTDLLKAQTISLTVLAIFQWFNVWNCRSDTRSLLKTNPFSNKFLIGATFIVIILHLFAIYHPFMQKMLHTVPLTITEWLFIIPMGLAIIIVEEIRKRVFAKPALDI